MGPKEIVGLILSVVALGTLLLAGLRYWWCWYVGLAGLTIWIGYAVATAERQYVPMIAAYGAVYGTNAVRWTRRHRAGRPIEVRFDPDED